MTTGAGEYPDDNEKWFGLHRQDIREAQGNKYQLSFLKKIFDIRFPNPKRCHCCGQNEVLNA